MGVEFEEDNLSRKYQSRAIIGQPEMPSMSNFLIKTGIVKTSSQAYGFLVFLIFFCLIAAGVIYYHFVVNAVHPPIPASVIYGTH